MSSLFRPLLSSLLCCVIAFGQLPALLHVATCHGHAHCHRVVAEQESPDVCSHGFHHYTSESKGRSSSDRVVRNEESPAVPLHDSEHCAVCHSLANPVGLIWNFELPLVQECLVELASICADRLPVEASFTMAQPRGPPAVA
ncbi:MAG: DUF2946 domain-containing protein [Planctomycetes bacterium]|nr:DUF2946 domain-containing protein [Planctomycetota bacterium]